MTELVQAWVVPFLLALVRLSAFMAALPVFASETAPLRVRAAFAVTLAGVLVAASPAIVGAELSPAPLLVEALIGALLGLIVRLVLAAVELAAELLSLQMGLGFAQLVDPLSGGSASPLGALLAVAPGAALFASDAHLTLVRGLAHSTVRVPLGAGHFDLGRLEVLVRSAAGLFKDGVRIALPIAAVLFGGQLAFALLTKVAPQLNVWALGFLATSGLALAALAVGAPTLIHEIVALLRQGTVAMAEAVG